jgi:hypothetical protein
MPIQSIINSLRYHARTRRQHDASSSCQPNTSNLGSRLAEVFTKTWDLGFTSFGGPPVHFQILHRRFVEGLGFNGSKWIDEQTVNAPQLEPFKYIATSADIEIESIKNYSPYAKPYPAQHPQKWYSVSQ